MAIDSLFRMQAAHPFVKHRGHKYLVRNADIGKEKQKQRLTNFEFNSELINLGFDPRRPVLQDVVSWRKRAGSLGVGEIIDKLGKAQPPHEVGEVAKWWPLAG